MDWAHINLWSTSGARIALDFQKREENRSSNKPAGAVIAENIWANVEREDLGSEDQVRMVVVNDKTISGRNGSPHNWREQDVFTVDLEAAPERGRFTGKLPDIEIHTDTYWQETTTEQRVAVVINGEWQKDPVQPFDFKVDMSKA